MTTGTVVLVGCAVEELAHTAEIGLRVTAPEADRLFACAALALFSLMDASSCGQLCRRDQIVVESFDVESLMVDWLNRLLHWHETGGWILAAVEINEWKPERLAARITGARPLSPPSRHIKAVTYHQLVVRQEDGWLAHIFVDI